MVMAEMIMVTVMMMLIIMVIVAENGVGFVDDDNDDENPKVNHWRNGRMPAYRPTLERQLLQPF